MIVCDIVALLRVLDGGRRVVLIGWSQEPFLSCIEDVRRRYRFLRVTACACDELLVAFPCSHGHPSQVGGILLYIKKWRHNNSAVATKSMFELWLLPERYSICCNIRS